MPQAMGVDQEGGGDGVYGHKLSTVVPGKATGDGVVHEFANADLVVKLHYFRAVYYFRQSEVIAGLAITDYKRPMFPWLDVYYPVTGRIRRAEAGRPLIKCNDCGLRIVEAKCGRTMEEWLEVEDSTRWRLLVPEKIVGPELQFSPFIYIQFTQFKCGGLAIGYSWSHILGDAISATNCINFWGELLGGKSPPNSPKLRNSPDSNQQKATQNKPAPVKQVDIAGDCWVTPATCKMATYSFKIGESEAMRFLPEQHRDRVPPFEIISALFWQCLAKIRSSGGESSKLAITICRPCASAKSNGLLSNRNFKISTVASDSSAAGAELSELAALILQQEADDLWNSVEDLVDIDSGKPDFVLYGANLTFVDMEGVDLYGLEIKGQKAVHVDYSIDGVGDEGAVLVLQVPPGQESDHAAGASMIRERIVRVILPEEEITQLCQVLGREFGIA